MQLLVSGFCDLYCWAPFSKCASFLCFFLFLGSRTWTFQLTAPSCMKLLQNSEVFFHAKWQRRMERGRGLDMCSLNPKKLRGMLLSLSTEVSLVIRKCEQSLFVISSFLIDLCISYNLGVHVFHTFLFCFEYIIKYTWDHYARKNKFLKQLHWVRGVVDFDVQKIYKKC